MASQQYTHDKNKWAAISVVAMVVLVDSFYRCDGNALASFGDGAGVCSLD